MRQKYALEHSSHLLVVPSIHCRVMFGVLVQQACAEYRPDVIAVELTPFTGAKVREVWKHFNEICAGEDKSIYPPLLVLVQLFKQYSQDTSYAVPVPLTPGDSLMEAVRLALENDIPIEFIDHQPWQKPDHGRMPLIEDGLVLEEGIDAYYNKKIKCKAEETRNPTIDEPREKHMALKLDRLLEAGKRVLFVCGAAHWGKIHKLLEDPRRLGGGEEFLDDFEPFKTVLLWLDQIQFSPYLADLPAVVREYESLRRDQKVQHFNHAKAWQNISKRILNRLEEIKDDPPGVRDVMQFFEFLKRLCLHRGYLFPSVQDIIDASRSCSSEEFSRIVYEEVFRYPSNPPDEASLPVPLGQLTEIRSNGGVSATIDGERVVFVGKHSPDYVYVRQVAGKGKKDGDEEENLLELLKTFTTFVGPVEGKDKAEGRDGTETGQQKKPTKRWDLDGDEEENLLDLLKDSGMTPDEIKRLLRESLIDSMFNNKSSDPSQEFVPPEDMRDNFEQFVHKFLRVAGEMFEEYPDFCPRSSDESTAWVNQMCLRARTLASIKMENPSFIEVNGVYRGVPDIRRTIRSQIRGDNQIYMKSIHRGRLNSLNLFEQFDPIVWVFEPYDSEKHTFDPGCVNVDDTWYSDHIKYFEKVPATPMETIIYYLGAVLVFTPDYCAKDQVLRLRRWIRSGRKKHLPKFNREMLTSEIWAPDAPIYTHLTPEERNTSLKKHEILCLAAIHYARRYVLWISDRTLWPNKLLKTIGKRQRKTLVCLTLDDFSSHDIERLREYEMEIPSEFIDWLVDEIYSALQDSGLLSALRAFL